MHYDFSIDPDKWVNIGDIKLEENTPYWFKKTNGKIVMGIPYSNGYSSGIANIILSDGIMVIDPGKFHLVRDAQVQPFLKEE